MKRVDLTDVKRRLTITAEAHRQRRLADGARTATLFGAIDDALAAESLVRESGLDHKTVYEMLGLDETRIEKAMQLQKRIRKIAGENGEEGKRLALVAAWWRTSLTLQQEIPKMAGGQLSLTLGILTDKLDRKSRKKAPTTISVNFGSSPKKGTK